MNIPSKRLQTHTVTGAELYRRVNGPEYMRAGKLLGRYMGVGTANQEYGQTELKRLVNMLIDKNDKRVGPKILSAYTILTEGMQHIPEYFIMHYLKLSKELTMYYLL